MLLNNEKKKLFDTSYEAYLKITGCMEGFIAADITDPFSDNPTITDMICSLDLFLQGCLLKIAAASGEISEEKMHFITTLPDEFDELCARTRGYRGFLKNLTVESLQAQESKFFDFTKTPEFLLIMEADPDFLPLLIQELKIIFDSFVAMDHESTEEETIQAAEILNLLESCRRPAGLRQAPKEGESEQLDQVSEEQTESLDNILQELFSLTGLENVKKEVMDSVNMVKINNIRKSMNLPELQISNHMVFTGNPGTGKTTVARILARIYRALGVVSKGQLVEADRSSMIAGYMGQTAMKTAHVIRSARGGILFIDEAYSLNSGYYDEFGKEAIDTLVKGMEDYRDDLVVIAAGYDREMKEFISSNPGLRSRFNKYICFEDYSSEEMLEIFKHMADEAKYILSPDAESAVLHVLENKQACRDFGNARGVRNIFEKMITKQAERVLMISAPTEEQLCTLKQEDVPDVFA